MSSILNIAAYKFADLRGLPDFRRALRQVCAEQQLRGTILLSGEGINMFVAGPAAGIDELLQVVRTRPELADIEVKRSFSEEAPFHRMLVKIKKEIIPFGVPGIEPQRYSSRRISPRELKQWLDEGRVVTLLDTRNRFEVDAGTFENAIELGIDDFRQLPAAVQGLPQPLKHQPLVTFCTGGIRCEKAAPFIEQQGFTNVYQLDGGILKYFEQCGGDYFRGDCFVFDQRVALDPGLRESRIKQCFVCQALLSVEDQASPRYVPSLSCPKCYRVESEVRQELIDGRHAAIRRITQPLPGSIAYDNLRPMSVPLRFDGMELIEFLEAMRTHLTREQWEAVCRENRLTCRGERVGPGRIVRSGERLQHHMPATLEPDVDANIRILYEDDAIVVVNKPAPLPMHPCGRFNRNSLTWILAEVYQPLQLRPAHRLDADTTGIVVFSKTGRIARQLQPQFDSNRVKKTYLARVIGQPDSDSFECHEPISALPAEDGLRWIDPNGLPASTRFRTIAHCSDGTSLVEAMPLTGRTNQIRLHLWSLGFPILGDVACLPGGLLARLKTLSVGDPPLCLHAAAIEFDHPSSGDRRRFDAPIPPWAFSP